MKKIFTLFAAMLCGIALNAKTLYLNPGVWAEADAVIFVHSWTGTDGNVQDIKMNTVSGSILSVDIPDGNEKVIFVRMPNGSTALDWNTKWDQTSDLEIPSDKNMYVVTGWHDGYWDNYSGSTQGGNTPGGDNQGEQGSTADGEYDYYLMGNLTGAKGGDITVPTAEELFEKGVLTYTFPGDPNNGNRGYFFVMRCEAGQVIGDGYMLLAYSDASHGTLYSQKVNAGANQKLGVAGPTVTFYLYDNGDGTLELSIEQLAGKTLVGSKNSNQNQAMENVSVQTQSEKFMQDGRLLIRRGEKVYDATGRQVQ